MRGRGFNSDSFCQHLLVHRILPLIPLPEGHSAPQKTDWRHYRNRNRIERMFNRFKQMRHIMPRYDMTALSFISFLNLAGIRLWIRSFSMRPTQWHRIFFITSCRPLVASPPKAAGY
ncbi:transposase [Gluconobacter cerinus]|nr:transposase [Gluconobacter cerinus]MBS1021855.1 transposase [Gluconobacter cerinus]